MGESTRPVTKYLENGSDAQRLVADLIEAVEGELASWQGLRGRTARLGYATCQRFRPSFIDDNVDRMMPELARILDPHVRDGLRADGVSITLLARRDGIVDDTLALIDRAADATRHAPVRALYARLRPSGAEYLKLLLPAVAPVVERHLIDRVDSNHDRT